MPVVQSRGDGRAHVVVTNVAADGYGVRQQNRSGQGRPDGPNAHHVDPFILDAELGSLVVTLDIIVLFARKF
jgi:hypothetical protein